MQIQQRILTIVLLAAVALAGCSTAAPGSPTKAPDNSPATIAAQTIVAQLTQESNKAAKVVELTATSTPPPPAPTNTEAPPPPPTPTPVAAAPSAAEPPAAAPAPTQAVEVIPTVAPTAASAAEGLPQVQITPLGGGATGNDVLPQPSDVGGGAPSAQPPAMLAETPTFAIPTVEQVQTTPMPDGNFQIVYHDNFISPGFWHVESTPEWKFSFGKGGYRILSNVESDAVWSVMDKEGFSDVRLETSASKSEGPRSGGFGLVCRHQDASHYYLLSITAEGSYAIYKRIPGKLISLGKSTAPSGAINILGSNLLRADCIGSTLTLYVNGQKLLEAQDKDYANGAVGMAVVNGRETGTLAIFRDFAILVPK